MEFERNSSDYWCNGKDKGCSRTVSDISRSKTNSIAASGLWFSLVPDLAPVSGNVLAPFLVPISVPVRISVSVLDPAAVSVPFFFLQSVLIHSLFLLFPLLSFSQFLLLMCFVIVPLFVPVRNLVCIPLPFCVSVLIVVLFSEPVLDPDLVTSPVDVPVSVSIPVHVLFLFFLFFSACVYVLLECSLFSFFVRVVNSLKEIINLILTCSEGH